MEIEVKEFKSNNKKIENFISDPETLALFKRLNFASTNYLRSEFHRLDQIDITELNNQVHQELNIHSNNEKDYKTDLLRDVIKTQRETLTQLNLHRDERMPNIDKLINKLTSLERYMKIQESNLSLEVHYRKEKNEPFQSQSITIVGKSKIEPYPPARKLVAGNLDTRSRSIETQKDIEEIMGNTLQIVKSSLKAAWKQSFDGLYKDTVAHIGKYIPERAPQIQRSELESSVSLYRSKKTIEPKDKSSSLQFLTAELRPDNAKQFAVDDNEVPFLVENFKESSF